MTNWIDAVEAVLAQLQASLSIPWDKDRYTPDPSTNQLPDTYMVYFLVDDAGTSWADGKETARQPRIQISLFYRDPQVSLTVPDAIEQAFMDAGFTRNDSGTIPYQDETQHYGWRCDFYLYQHR